MLRALHVKDGEQQQVLNVRELCKVDVDQFYGIEIHEWPVRIAEVGLWLMDHQMNVEVAEAFGQSFRRLPLQNTPHIVQGNALRLDWNIVLPRDKCSYILGNPPFVGKQFATSEQKQDMALICGKLKGSGVLDYVTGWYFKAGEYIQNSHIVVGFVSTNSITQGEQVGILWNDLFARYQLKIHFGHRTFAWESEARGKAHVHVVIMGFAAFDITGKRIYDYETDGEAVTVTTTNNVSPYLVGGSDLVVLSRSKPLCDAPEIVFGNMPNDGGYLLLTDEEKSELLKKEPGAAKFVRLFLGAQEFINGQSRWCLWLKDASPAELRELPEVMKRVQGVRTHREESKRETTQELAKKATLFGEIRQPNSNYLLVPSVSSESRPYIPIGFMSPNVIGSNLVLLIPEATLFHFGVLSSAMHMAWVRQICGRLKSDYRYSNNLVYNNFPWLSEVEAKRRAAVESAAQAVLDARTRFLPPKGTSTLADLYDPLSMPPALAQAHTDLDRAVDRCYRSELFHSDRERVEHLFALYERLTTPLLPMTPRRGRSRRRTND